MPFELTPQYIVHFVTEAAAGNPGPVIQAVHPEVKWRIGSDTKDDVAKTGHFVR